jgi:hypothetical protein
MRIRTLLIAGAALALLAGMTTANINSSTQNRGPGPGPGPTVPVLSDAEAQNILYMRLEEKLARDVYHQMYELWPACVFANISEAEQQHMDAVKNLIDRYGLTDPVVDDTVGEFPPKVDPDDPDEVDFQAMYTELVEAGSVSLEEALKVGVQIEELDIADLEQALEETSSRNVQRVFENLLAGSNNHLDAFNKCLDGDCPCL